VDIALTITIAVGIIAIAVAYYLGRRRANLGKTKYKFLTTAAHKLRTPLTRIKWGLSDLAKRESIPLEDRKVVNDLRNSNDQLLQISDAMLEELRMQADVERLNFTIEDVGEIAKEVLQNFSKKIVEQGIVVENAIPYPSPKVKVDRKKIKEVLTTLMSNAITYTHKGGHIKVAISSDSKDTNLSISDTGIGLEPGEERHVFKMFYRGDKAALSNTEGLGLNLSLSKDIAKRHGGTLTAISPGPNRGATFTLTLPKSPYS